MAVERMQRFYTLSAYISRGMSVLQSKLLLHSLGRYWCPTLPGSLADDLLEKTWENQKV